MALVQAFTFPTSKEIEQIERVKLPRLTNDSPIFKLFPFQGKRTHILEWQQEDDWGGMQQIRGLDGMPPSVARVGMKSFMQKPGIYGEHIPLSENELTTRAALGNPSVPIAVDDLVMSCQDFLLERRLTRIEWLCWQVVVNSAFVVLDLKGAILHRDQFTLQRYDAPVALVDEVNSAPFKDFQNIAPMGRGYSTSFGTGAVCYVNQITATRILNNRNPNDLFGKKVNGGNSVIGLGDVNGVFANQGLPRIEVYDEGYFNESKVWSPYIPDNTGIVIGRRSSNAPLGNFRYTINVNNPGGAPAPYTRVLDHFDRRIPRLIEVHDGFNGGPVLYFPGSVLQMKWPAA